MLTLVHQVWGDATCRSALREAFLRSVRIEKSANLLAPRNSNGEDHPPRMLSQEAGSLPDTGECSYILRALNPAPRDQSWMHGPLP